MKAITKNWVTTIAGVGAILTLLASFLLDISDPKTPADVQPLVNAVRDIAILIAGGGLIAAKDGRE